jgi:peptidoglycan-associated lipoprotein
VHFDFDRYNLRPEALMILDDAITKLQANPTLYVTNEGHCDSSGTVEYNLALGERRANAAKTYLVGLGVAAERISTVSYGKERPVALGSDESSWARNRRAVTVTVQ